MISFTMLNLGKDNRLDRAWVKFQNSGHSYLLQFVQILFPGHHRYYNILYNILLFIDEFVVATVAIFFPRSGKSKGIIWLVET